MSNILGKKLESKIKNKNMVYNEQKLKNKIKLK